MKQVIRYLYEYENGNRIRNVGFIKLEKRMDKCAIHIHGKNLDFGQKKKLEVFVFYVQGGDCIGIPQGVIEGEAPMINYILKFEPEDAATEAVPEERQQSEEPKVRESLIEHVEKLVEQQEFQEEIEKYIPPKTRTYEKIQRQDIARLPRTQWHLANNSFLLHGFYNYHHLLYIEEGENRWIGVPGIYHEKEQAAARAFGFPQFHRVMDADLELSAEEKNTFDDFGYWCRQI